MKSIFFLKSLKSLVIIVFFSVASSVFSQTVYYADNVNGNDTNSGLVGFPKKTFTSVFATAPAGSIIDLTGTFTWGDVGETTSVTSGFTINKNMTIRGQGADQTSIQANALPDVANRRVFTINSGVTVVLEKLTIKNGKVANLDNSVYPADGGGIYNSGILTLNYCRITQNYAIAGSNFSGGAGGGISHIANNTMTINGCTFDNNQANTGGALVNEFANASGRFIITNSTFAYNKQLALVATVGGGAIWILNGNNIITNSTFAYNDLNNSNGSGTGDGASILVRQGNVKLKNNIFVNGTRSGQPLSGGRIEIAFSGGSATDEGNNIFGTQTGITFSATSWQPSSGGGYQNVGDTTKKCLLNVDSVLQTNGATNGIVSLKTTGVNIEEGSTTANNGISIPTIDQRGNTRVGTPDIGAYEYTDPAPFVSCFSPSTGGAGTSVAIRGVNFTGAFSVKFNSVEATSFTFNSDVSITAIAPESSTGLISVTTNQGTGNSSSNFVYPPTINLTGTLTAFSKCVGSPSAAQTFTVSGSNLTANLVVAAYTNLEYSLNGTTYSASLSLTPTSGSVAATIIYVRMTTASASLTSGNISLSSTNATTRIVAVSGTVSASPTITGSTSLHVGQTITLTGSGTPNASTPWASSNTSIASISSSGVVTAVIAGTATITYMNSNGCSASSLITVTPAPTVTASNLTAGATNVTYTFTYTLGQAASSNVFYLFPMPTGYIIPNPSSFPLTHVTMSVNGTNIPSSTWANVGVNWQDGVQINRSTPTGSSIVVVVTGVTNSSSAGSKTFSWKNANGGGAAIESFSASLTLTPSNQWTGATNNNWTTASNWSLNTVPNEQSVISIPSTSNLPEISTSVVVSGLTVSSSLVIRPSGVLRVNGNIINNGQIIFKSDATGSGTFDAFSGTITGTGTVTVERYIPAKRAFRFLSPSVTTTTSIRVNWQNNGTNTSGIGTHITGTGGATNGFDATSTNNPSLFAFANGAWSAVTNTNVNVLTAGTPYRLMVRGDRTTDLTSNTSSATATTLRATGTLKTGNYTPTLNQSADGFSLIGNPYQAPIDIKAILTASTNMSSNVVYYWDPTLNARGGYVTRDLTTDVNDVTSSFNQYVQPGQAVFVKKDNTANVPTMTITEANKSVSNGAAGVFRNTNTNTSTDFGLLRVNLQANNQTIEGALALFDDNYTWNVTSEDATKMANLDEEVSFVQNNTNLAIALQSNPSATSELPIKIDKMRHTNYQWQFELNNYSGAIPYLFDTLNNSYTQINNGTVVPFTADNNTTNRFKIVFQNGVLSNASFQNELAIYPNPAKSGASFYVDGITEATVTVYNLLGQTFPLQTKSQGTTLQVTPTTNLSQGVYLVNITTQGTTQQVKWIVE